MPQLVCNKQGPPLSLARIVAILKCFNIYELELSTTAISRKTEIHKTTLHRLLLGMTEFGLLEKDIGTRKYRIGHMLYATGNLFVCSIDLIKDSESVIGFMSDLVGETVNLGIREGGDVILIMVKESKETPVGVFRRVGRIVPAYSSGMGKALLAELNDSEIDNIYPEEELRPRTKHTIGTKAKLKLELAQIRVNGISSSQREGHEEVVSVASVVRDASGNAAAAVSIVVPTYRMNNRYHERLSIFVKMATSLISYQLGYHDPHNSVRQIEEIRSWWEENQ